MEVPKPLIPILNIYVRRVSIVFGSSKLERALFQELPRLVADEFEQRTFVRLNEVGPGERDVLRLDVSRGMAQDFIEISVEVNRKRNILCGIECASGGHAADQDRYAVTIEPKANILFKRLSMYVRLSHS